jgi:hypothetical protein
MTEETREDAKPLALPPPEWAATRAATWRRRERIGWLLLLALAAIGLAGSSPFWAPRLANVLPWSSRAETVAMPAPHDDRLDALAQEQAALAQEQGALAQKLAQIDGQIRGLGATAVAVNALEERVAALDKSSRGGDPAARAGLETQLQALAQTTAQTGDRLAKLETRRDAVTSERSDTALLLAIGQLRAQIETSLPFAAALGAVMALGRRDPQVQETLAPLKATAEKGIPSRAVLAQRFEQEVVAAALHAAPAAEAGSVGWGAWFQAKLRGLVTIRPVGGAGAEARDPTDASLARAEAALAGGDLGGAVAAAESLPAPAAAAAQAWLAEARQRLAAEQAVAQLTESVTGRLAELDRTGAAEAH